jgi:hypothetical protein
MLKRTFYGVVMQDAMAEHHFDIVFARRADGPAPRFIQLIEQYAHTHGLAFIHCGEADHAQEMHRALLEQRLTIGCLIDYMGRSFRNDTEFGRAVRATSGLVIVDPDAVLRFGDKATIHRALVRAGISMPYTLLIAPEMPDRAITSAERRQLGTHLICKPARGSGAGGVVLDFDGTAAGMAAAREYDDEDDYLIQEFVQPVVLDGRPAWFRVYNCFGRVMACWWHPESHATQLVTAEEIEQYGLHGLARISATLKAISGYTWFSTEIALAQRGTQRVLLPIDYLNNKCFMLCHSEVGEHGLPDQLAEMVAGTIVECVAARKAHR